MMNPYAWAVASVLLFGVWGVTAKLAVDAGGWKLVFIFAQALPVTLAFVLFAAGGPHEIRWTTVRWAVLTGGIGALGVLCFNVALGRAPASRIVTISAMYPAFTVLLSALLLSERLTPRHGVGVALALAGLALLA